jgi:hypothetical protein
MYDYISDQDVVDARAVGQKLAKTYDTKDADDAATFCLIPDTYADRLKLRISVLAGIRSIKNDNYNFHLLSTMFEQSLRALAHINRVNTY